MFPKAFFKTPYLCIGFQKTLNIDAEPSASQIAAKARFAKVVAAVRTILTDPTEKAKLKAEYKSQTKIGSLFGYAMHKLNGNYDANGDLIGD